MNETFWKTSDVAKFFGVTVRTIKNWRQSGKLIPVSCNEHGNFLYSSSQLNSFKKLNLLSQNTSANNKKSDCLQHKPKTSKTKSTTKSQSKAVAKNPVITDSNNKNFGKILQGKPTNALTATSGKNVTQNLIGNAEVICNDVQIFIEQFSQVKLNVQTYKVLDACILKLTRNFPYGKKVTDDALLLHKDITISTDEYMEMTGLKDRKQAYNQLKEAMNTLYRISFKWDDKVFIRKKESIAHYEIRLAEAMQSTATTDVARNIFERGSVTLSLSMKMARFLATAYVMPYPYHLLTINSHKNPHSYFIGRKLAIHHNMNITKKNSNRISVKTLIESIPELPKYENVLKSSGKGVTQQIIQPFERDLIALKETYGILKDWHYCNSLDEPITDAQAERYNYSTWIEWLVEFEFNDYPNQTERILKSKLSK